MLSDGLDIGLIMIHQPNVLIRHQQPGGQTAANGTAAKNDISHRHAPFGQLT